VGTIAPVVPLPQLDELPDSCFVEDSVVMHGNRALVLPLGHSSRRVEGLEMAGALKGMAKQLGLVVHSTLIHPPAATLAARSGLKQLRGVAADSVDVDDVHIDGGDVLWTGREFFVGVSSRTTLGGLCALASSLNFHMPVVGVNLGALAEAGGVDSNALHLKSVVSMLADDLLLAPRTPLGRIVGEYIQSCRDMLRRQAAMYSDSPTIEASRPPPAVTPPMTRAAVRSGGVVVPPMGVTWVESEASANVVIGNNTVIHREEYPEDSSTIRAAVEQLNERFPDSPIRTVPVTVSELAKADGALTCCSVLIPSRI
jgi:N-dimethylarginine dimethylaminohydrolase